MPILTLNKYQTDLRQFTPIESEKNRFVYLSDDLHFCIEGRVRLRRDDCSSLKSHSHYSPVKHSDSFSQ
jgi:hypothetical protein